MKKLFATTLCLTLGLAMSSAAMAASDTLGQPNLPQDSTTSQDVNSQTTPNEIIDGSSRAFDQRLSNDVVDKPAPQVGQTRAAIEAIYGPAQTALAPNKDYQIYTNEYDLVDGKIFNRNLSPKAVKIYEVSYKMGDTPSANDTASDIKLRVIPRIGDHKNLVGKLLGSPVNTAASSEGQHLVYEIPASRYPYYRDVLSTPYEAVNTYYSKDGFLVGQDFMPSSKLGGTGTALTSSGRYVEYETKYQAY